VRASPAASGTTSRALASGGPARLWGPGAAAQADHRPAHAPTRPRPPARLPPAGAGPLAPWVGVHSAQANKLALALLLQRRLPQLGEYSALRQEVAYGAGGDSRVDFVLCRPCGAQVYVEVKSVTLAEPYAPAGGGLHSAAPAPAPKGGRRKRGGGAAAGEAAAAEVQQAAAVASAAAAAAPAAPAAAGGSMIALFPDTVSERAQKHVRELMAVVAAGHEAVCLFLVQRGDCSRFAPCHAKDPAYGALLLQAQAAGVQVLAVGCSLEPAEGGGVVRALGPVALELSYGLPQGA
jgi:DNA-binding sugar fermentation-stimulating protein